MRSAGRTMSPIWTSGCPHREKIANGTYRFLLITPPCNTTSRATYANPWGAKPTRHPSHPNGFPWLVGGLKRKVDEANEMFNITFDACNTAQAAGIPWFSEHPEDLGLTKGGAACFFVANAEDQRFVGPSWGLYLCILPMRRNVV